MIKGYGVLPPASSRGQRPDVCDDLKNRNMYRGTLLAA